MHGRLKRGFTLIELLVVIAIIALLSSIVLAMLGSARERAQYASVVAALRQTELAFQMLYDERNCWPREGSTDCSGHAGGNPTVSALLNNPNFGLSRYISETIPWPFANEVWRYDNDGNSRPTHCNSYNSNGVNLYIVATPEQYERLNTIIDGDPDPTTNTARYCGKVIHNGTDQLMYVLSPTS